MLGEHLRGDRGRLHPSLQAGLRDRLGGSNDFLPAAVVEGHHERHAGVVFRQFFTLVEQRQNIVLEAVAISDHLDAHAGGMKFRHVLPYEPAQDVE